MQATKFPPSRVTQVRWIISAGQRYINIFFFPPQISEIDVNNPAIL